MNMRRSCFALAGWLVFAGVATAWSATPPGNSVQGHRLFMEEGCFTCHGTTGMGSIISGPQIAPGAVPWIAFMRQLRTPYNSWRYGNVGMPRFGKDVLTDSQAADIYAYLLSIKPGPSAAQVPLLRQ